MKYKVMNLVYDNIDTDIIIPKQFLKQTSKDGLGKYAFYNWRYDAKGNKKQTILNENDDKQYNVLITGHNFGCGSSREHAAWALADYGFDIIIASSFSDIFYQNWLNNNKIPLIIANDEIMNLVAEGIKNITINLLKKRIIINDKCYEIKISKKRQICLLEDIDEIDYTTKFTTQIKEYELLI
ncbi:3-isopropylmalate dehydratase small subunit [Erysipelotrichaceae bacterium OttesenSCG-928-M19]|nr:3-isopropylmalate dehydratase small subunit [Erysipelotrichaceae bacterium OttesenSCG-928-M19]